MLQVQKFLRDGGSLEDLTNTYAIDVKRHKEYPNLCLLKYDQFDSPFGEAIVRECRGLILNSDDNWSIVSYPFNKFFNYGEGNAATIDWQTATVQEKIDGSLCTIFVYDGKWNMSTSGSPDAGGNVGDFDFTFNDLFWKTFTYELPPIDCNKCFMFEITSQFNKIVVRHFEPSLTLLGGRDLTSLQELTPEQAHEYFPECKVARQFPLTSLEEIVKSFDTFSGNEMEGYIVCDSSFRRIKCKSPQYVALHHLKDSLGSSKRALIEIVRSGEIEEVCANLTEFSDILHQAKERLDALVLELETLYEETKIIDSQKVFAQTIIGRKCRCSGALFAVRSGKAKSIRAFICDMTLDSVVELLGYRTEEMTMDELNVKSGDTCRLKSGGPLMTVSRLTRISIEPSEIMWWCTWFDGVRLCGNQFSDSVLIRSEEK